MTGRGEVSASQVAESGAEAWRRVVVLQRAAEPDHGDWYGLAGEMVATVRALEDLAAVVIAQVIGYGHDHVLRDDEGQDPHERLADVVRGMRRFAEQLCDAEFDLHQAWSASGHIAVEDGAR